MINKGRALIDLPIDDIGGEHLIFSTAGNIDNKLQALKQRNIVHDFILRPKSITVQNYNAQRLNRDFTPMPGRSLH